MLLLVEELSKVGAFIWHAMVDGSVHGSVVDVEKEERL